MVGAAMQICQRLGILWVDRDAYADRSRQELVLHRKRRTQALNQIACHAGGVTLRVQAIQDHYELVATEASEHVRCADAIGEARGELTQELVARAMAIVVVDELEAVQVDADQRDLG